MFYLKSILLVYYFWYNEKGMAFATPNIKR